MTAFFFAVAMGKMWLVDLLMETGTNIYEKARFIVEYYEPDEDDIKTIQFRLDRKILKKEIEVSAFAFTFNHYNKDIVLLLLSKGFDPNENILEEDRLINFINDPYELPNNAVNIATKKNDTELVKLLIEKGATNFCLKELILACKNLNLELIKLFLESGVEINYNKLGFDEKNPLSIVCANSAVEPYGKCASNLQVTGQTVFEIIKLLIDYGAEVTYDSPLLAACSFDYKNSIFNKTTGYENVYYADVNLEIITLLIDKGADVNDTDNDGKSILMYASEVYNAYEVVKILIDNGADVNHKDNFGNSVIMNIGLDSQYADYTTDHHEKIEKKAPAFDNDEIVMPMNILILLLGKGAEVNSKNNIGMTALMKYALEGNLFFVKILLEHGADISVKSEMTALDLANNDKIKKAIETSHNNSPQKLVKLLSNFTIEPLANPKNQPTI